MPVKKTCCGVVSGFVVGLVVFVVLAVAHYGIWMYADRINEYQLQSLESRLRAANPEFSSVNGHRTYRSPWRYFRTDREDWRDYARHHTSFLPAIADLCLEDLPVHDLSPLRGQRLMGISLFGTQVTDLTPLRGMPLRGVTLPESLPSLDGLQGAPLTEELCLGGAEVSDLSAIAGAPLETLWASGRTITDISALRGMPLKVLYLDFSSVTDLTPLSGMPLRDLSLADTTVVDLSPLNNQTLRNLELQRSKVTCLSGLEGLTLYKLNLSETEVEDLTPLKGMPLDLLRLRGTKVTDLTPLSGMPLTWLDLRDTMISDLSPLQGIKGIRVFIGNTPATESELPDWLLEGNVIVK